ncbi:MAG: NAD(P)-binding protein [Rhodospirillaceae bacterium]|nr:NAD(P)-binding protein [Rhodospirillaceae bacterium]
MFDLATDLPADTLASRAPRRIAVVGSGIAGLSAAWLLSRRYHVTLFEEAPRLGGHCHTVEVATPRGPVAVDTGFIVYNARTYPNLVRLFRHLGVATQPSDMSFAVSLGEGRLEYAGSRRFAGLFAQPRNLLRPRFWGMLAEILRFYREFRDGDLAALGDTSLGELLEGRGYGQAFREAHLLPLAAAIWSGSFRSILDFPAATFLAFCRNHGLLQVTRRPKWRTVTGRSRDYVWRLAAGISGPVRLGASIAAVRRDAGGIDIVHGGAAERFDRCVLAVAAPAALRLLAEPSPEERRVLGAFSVQPNHAILHRDAALMPKRRGCWASWNFIADAPSDPEAPVFVTYWLNRLQSLDPAMPLFLSLNPGRRPRDADVIAEFDYAHPQFDAAAIAAQAALPRLQGVRHTWYCGAWTGYGFHEDGLRSGMAAAAALGVAAPWSAADEPKSPVEA